MTDDELLASAFRKILTCDQYHYRSASDDGERAYVTLDSTWTQDDGLTLDEFTAIIRVASSPPTKHEETG